MHLHRIYIWKPEYYLHDDAETLTTVVVTSHCLCTLLAPGRALLSLKTDWSCSALIKVTVDIHYGSACFWTARLQCVQASDEQRRIHEHLTACRCTLRKANQPCISSSASSSSVACGKSTRLVTSSLRAERPGKVSCLCFASCACRLERKCGHVLLTKASLPAHTRIVEALSAHRKVNRWWGILIGCLLSCTHVLQIDLACMNTSASWMPLTAQGIMMTWQAHCNTSKPEELRMWKMQGGGVPHHAQAHAATPGGVKPAELHPHH